MLVYLMHINGLKNILYIIQNCYTCAHHSSYNPPLNLSKKSCPYYAKIHKTLLISVGYVLRVNICFQPVF